ncbi:hypothetical protein [Bradyrhizobium amphicarpaeae]|uniref:Uncharacterized protein n=1 Tax=Bradyrhizobium amphicarpaeae TaxID=1404768 RepID=A0A2U8PYZ5_9BRAD|nr:hypothetical protein [Bradyrhizobium amphicarpaeae]AWM02745.1 hypothetical protein CIT40_23765 [Bradyrhizobium amphicarpaeae]
MRWPIKGRAQPRLKLIRSLLRAVHAENTPEARGRRLLRDWLSAGQREQFDAARYFDVTGSDSGKRYRICYGTAANIRELDRNGKEGIGWCFAPTGALVPGDVMLAQKIALETAEASTLAIANRIPLIPRVAR